MNDNVMLSVVDSHYRRITCLVRRAYINWYQCETPSDTLPEIRLWTDISKNLQTRKLMLLQLDHYIFRGGGLLQLWYLWGKSLSSCYCFCSLTI